VTPPSGEFKIQLPAGMAIQSKLGFTSKISPNPHIPDDGVTQAIKEFRTLTLQRFRPVENSQQQTRHRPFANRRLLFQTFPFGVSATFGWYPENCFGSPMEIGVNRAEKVAGADFSQVIRFEAKGMGGTSAGKKHCGQQDQA